MHLDVPVRCCFRFPKPVAVEPAHRPSRRLLRRMGADRTPRRVGSKWPCSPPLMPSCRTLPVEHPDQIAHAVHRRIAGLTTTGQTPGTKPGCSPDAALFSSLLFVAAEFRARDGVLLLILLSRCASAPFLSSCIFSDGWRQTERRGSRVKGARCLRVHRSERGDPLTSAPFALGTNLQRKMGDHRFPSPLVWFLVVASRAACCCNLAASSCFTSLIWSSILSNASGASFFARRQRPQHVYFQQQADSLRSRLAPPDRARAASRCPTLPAGSPSRHHHSPSVRPSACAAVSRRAYSSSLTLKPMDFAGAAWRLHSCPGFLRHIPAED